MKRLPGIILGLGIAALGAVSWLKVAPPLGTLTFNLCAAAIGGGIAWAGLAAWTAGKVGAMIRIVSINGLVLSALLGCIEMGGRVGKIDFHALSGSSAAHKRAEYPPWTREPDVPLPEVFFVHPGPMTWTGQPLRTLEVLRLGTDNAYLDDAEITVTYDAEGFRNDAALKDWQVAVIGDSYTELGYLPHEQLTSAVVGQQSGMTVKNLGVCDSGLLAYARFLRAFGAAPSARHAVFVMFEGNDVQDTTVEWRAFQRYLKTGEREYRSTVETSFIKAVAEAVRAARNQPQPRSFQNAWFRSRGHEIPITISIELPIDPSQATPEQLQALNAGVADCAAEAKSLGLKPMLVYVPVNNRVYEGMLRFGAELPHTVQSWKPHGLPAHVAALCREHGLQFVDTTPVLRARAAEGIYVHNRILDCHVNAEGARIIGQVIAAALEADRRSTPGAQ